MSHPSGATATPCRVAVVDDDDVLTAVGQAPPTVFVTAHDDVKVASKSLRADGECLRKPFDDDHLLGAIARACTKVQ